MLSAGLEARTVALLEEVNTGAFKDDGIRVAVATLIAAGVPQKRALVVVDDAAATAAAEDAADS